MRKEERPRRKMKSELVRVSVWKLVSLSVLEGNVYIMNMFSVLYFFDILYEETSFLLQLRK